MQRREAVYLAVEVYGAIKLEVSCSTSMSAPPSIDSLRYEESEQVKFALEQVRDAHSFAVDHALVHQNLITIFVSTLT